MEGASDWMGTTLDVSGAPVGAGSEVLLAVLSFALIAVRILTGMGLFVHELPRRDHLGPRVAALVAAFVGAFALTFALAVRLGAVSVEVGYALQIMAFSLILGACVGVIYLLFDVSVWVALFCATAGYTAQNLATGMTELVAAVARELGANPSAPAFYLANDLGCMAVTFVCVYLLMARRIDHEGLSGMENRQMLAMMPVVSLAIIGFDVLIKSLTGAGEGLGYVVALRLFHGLACVATLWTEYQMLYRVRMERDRAMSERLLAERERQYELSRETIDAINVKCHDLKHQIRALGSGGAVVERSALDDLARDLTIYDCSVKTGNDALDTILTEKGLVCGRRGITLTVIADGGALARVAPADLYALFGNALDNAIEAASALADPARRSVSVTVRRAMGCACVHVENFFDGARSFSADGLPETTKADRASHGFGTRSMRQIAERYDGTFSARAEGGVFKLDVMIPLA